MTGYDDLQRKLKSLHDGTATKAVLLEVGQAVVRQANINLRPHDKTGNLARSIRVGNVSQSNQSVEVRAGGSQGVGYAQFLEYGTRPHIIRPKNKKALFFPSQRALTERAGSGAVIGFRKSGNVNSATMRKYGNLAFVHAKVVHHPGTRPVFYMTNAVKDTARGLQLNPTIVEVWNRA